MHWNLLRKGLPGGQSYHSLHYFRFDPWLCFYFKKYICAQTWVYKSWGCQMTLSSGFRNRAMFLFCWYFDFLCKFRIFSEQLLKWLLSIRYFLVTSKTGFLQFPCISVITATNWFSNVSMHIYFLRIKTQSWIKAKMVERVLTSSSG